MRIVLAEDLYLLRTGLERLLTENGFEVVEAVDNGPALLRALLERRPDVSVVDVRLPPTFTDEGLRAARCRAYRSWCCPSTSSSSTPGNCSPTGSAPSAICSRTACSTTTSSPTR